MSSLDVKFADMAPGTKAGWLRWARSHDWGCNATLSRDGRFIENLTDESEADGQRAFTNPRAMRNWAGY